MNEYTLLEALLTTLLKTIAQLTERAKALNLASAMELAERIYMGKSPDIKPPIKRKLESLVKPILKLRTLANEVLIHSVAGITFLILF